MAEVKVLEEPFQNAHLLPAMDTHTMDTHPCMPCMAGKVGSWLPEGRVSITLMLIIFLCTLCPQHGQGLRYSRQHPSPKGHKRHWPNILSNALTWQVPFLGRGGKSGARLLSSNFKSGARGYDVASSTRTPLWGMQRVNDVRETFGKTTYPFTCRKLRASSLEHGLQFRTKAPRRHQPCQKQLETASV